MTVKLSLTKPRHLHHSQHLGLSGPDRPQDPSTRRRTSRPARSCPPVRARARNDVGQKVVYKRREDGRDGDVYLDGIEFIDYGTDPAAMVSAFEAGEVSNNFETSPTTPFRSSTAWTS